MAIVALAKWLEKNGYTQDDYDFFDIDMLLPSDEEIKEYLLGYQPAVIGLSAILASTYGQVKRIAQIARQVCPDAWIIMGGHLAAAAHTVLIKTEVDICVAGDGEYPLVEFLDYVKAHGRNWDFVALSRIKGLCFIDGEGVFRFNGWAPGIPAEELELPDYDLFRRGLKDQPHLIENYFNDHCGMGSYDPRYQAIKLPRKTATMPTSKGCVARCTFCQRAAKGYRVISPCKIEEHLVYLKKTFAVTDIQLADENSGSNIKQIYEIAKLMKSHDLLWAQGGVRVTSFDAEDVKFMRDHNCYNIKFGLEAGSQVMLDVMDKKITVEGILKGFQYCIDADMTTLVSLWVLGSPGETDETIMETGRLAGKLAYMLGVPAHLLYAGIGSAGYVIPFPGTPIYEYAQKTGVLPTDPDGEEKYLLHLSIVKNAGKIRYCNISGAPKKEWYFWDILIGLEASRTYRELCRQSPVKSDTFCARSNIDGLRRQPSMTFFFAFRAALSTFSWAVCNPIVDALPRGVVYPILRNLNYLLNVVIKDTMRALLGRTSPAFPGAGVAKQRYIVRRHSTNANRAESLRREIKDEPLHANAEAELLIRGQ